jgi:hypothetical protein
MRLLEALLRVLQDLSSGAWAAIAAWLAALVAVLPLLLRRGDSVRDANRSLASVLLPHYDRLTLLVDERTTFERGTACVDAAVYNGTLAETPAAVRPSVGVVASDAEIRTICRTLRMLGCGTTCTRVDSWVGALSALAAARGWSRPPSNTELDSLNALSAACQSAADDLLDQMRSHLIALRTGRHFVDATTR